MVLIRFDWTDVSENFKILLSLLLTYEGTDNVTVKLISMNEIGNDRIDFYESLKRDKAANFSDDP